MATSNPRQQSQEQAWSVHFGGQTYGPYSASEVRQYLRDGSIPPDAVFYRPGMQGWVAVQAAFPGEVNTDPLQSIASCANSGATRQRVHHRRPQVVGFVQRWKTRSGGRSFIFQTILIGWTILIGMLMAGSLISLTPPRHSRSPYYDAEFDRNASAIAVMGSWTCLGGAWALLGVPLGIAAIATYEGNA